MIKEEDKIKTGYWQGEPIWRQKTAEERLRETKIDPKVAKLYIAINEKNS